MCLAPWEVVCDCRPRRAAEQMALAERAARALRPQARVFTWESPAISWGWKQPLPGWLARLRETGDQSGVALVERPTGGGIAWHGSDVALSVTAPLAAGWRLALLMQAVCDTAARLCRRWGPVAEIMRDAPGGGRIECCLAEASDYAVLAGGRKMAGFAARRYADAWLVQGSLLVQPLPEAIRRLVPAATLAATDRSAISLAEAAGCPVAPAAAARDWAAAWIAWMGGALDEQGLAHAL